MEESGEKLGVSRVEPRAVQELRSAGVGAQVLQHETIAEAVLVSAEDFGREVAEPVRLDDRVGGTDSRANGEIHASDHKSVVNGETGGIPCDDHAIGEQSAGSLHATLWHHMGAILSKLPIAHQRLQERMSQEVLEEMGGPDATGNEIACAYYDADGEAVDVRIEESASGQASGDVADE